MKIGLLPLLLLFSFNLVDLASLGADVPPGPRYVGSTVCKTCHAQIYERWKKTRMANVVRDPREHPDAILPDLAKPDPLVHFTKDDIALVYGSKWKQRCFMLSGGYNGAHQSEPFFTKYGRQI